MQGHFANRDKTGTARLLGREVKYMPFALRLRLREMQRSIGSTGFLHGPVVSFLIES